MITKLTLPGAAIAFSLLFYLLFTFSSCKRDDVNPLKTTASNNADSLTVNSVHISGADYVWGELAINKKTESDVLKYDAVTGRIDSVLTYDNNGVLVSSIGFTYSGNKITLSSPCNDEYDLDNSGKVVYHSTQEIQNGHHITEIERYGYDAQNYLNKVTMSSNFDDYVGPVFSVIDYEVSNGNYTKYTLSNTDNGTITRQYFFKYNTGKKVNNAGALFAPIFSNNTVSNIDKYLNYGKSSVNLLTGINYKIRDLDNTIITGSFNVFTTINADNYITSLKLDGNAVTGFPSDNLSPLPRELNFTLSGKTTY